MKVLVIRLSSIGDIVLTSPVVRCLKQQLNCELHFLVKQKFMSLVANNPYIDKVLTLNDNLNEIIELLRHEKYDYVIDLHHNTRSFLVKISLKAKSFTYNKLDIRKWILTRFKVNIMPENHIVDRYFTSVEHLGVKYDGAGLDFFIGREEKLPAGVMFSEKYVVFAIGGTYTTKIVPCEIVSKLCGYLRTVRIVLIGGKENLAEGNRISMANSNVTNLAGKLTIAQSALIMRDAAVVLTGDTGMMHVAAALKKNIVSFWGNTVPAFGMYPFFPSNHEGVNHVVENKALHCRPCSKLGYKKCPKKHFMCMNFIDEKIFDEIKVLIDNCLQ